MPHFILQVDNMKGFRQIIFLGECYDHLMTLNYFKISTKFSKQLINGK